MTYVQAVPRARWYRIVLAAFVMYSLAYMDRINLGFALPTMRPALHLSASNAGLAGSIFFVGYIVPQLFAGPLVSRIGPRRLIAVYMTLWGIFAMASGLSQNFGELLAFRALLGLAEGGVYPALLVLLTNWFPKAERGRAISFFLVCIPVGSAVMSPLAGLILSHTGWRELFFIQGALPLVWALVWIFLISDRPGSARWLRAAELAYIEDVARVDESPESATDKTPIAGGLLVALRHRTVLTMAGIYFLLQVGQYGFGLWLPTVVKDASGGSIATVGWLTAAAWAAGAVGLVVNGWHSDRTRERRFHASIPVAIGALFLFASIEVGHSNSALTLVLLILSVGFFQAYNGVIWALTSDLVAATSIGTVAGIVNGIGTFGGGIVGPWLVGRVTDLTHSSLDAQLVLVVALLLAAISIPFTRIRAAAHKHPITAAAPSEVSDLNA